MLSVLTENGLSPRAGSFNTLNSTFHLRGLLVHWVYLSINVFLLSDVYLSLGKKKKRKKKSETCFWFQSKLLINCPAQSSLVEQHLASAQHSSKEFGGQTSCREPAGR